MTLPHEELRSVKASRQLARDILFTRPAPSIRSLREQARRCLRHFPFDTTLDRRWSDVCPDCEDTIDFCKCKRPGNTE